jgi:peptide/nickel transport system permease protein
MSQQELINQVKKERRFRARVRAYFESLFSNWTAAVGFIIVVTFIFTALYADQLAMYNPTEDDYTEGFPQYNAPDTTHLLGTDWAGQDVYSRVLYGARSAVMAGIIAIGVGLTGGMLLGAISGFLGGSVDNVIMRIVDAWMSVPSFFMLLIIVAALRDQPWNPNGEYTLYIAMFFIGFMGIPGYARIIRGSVLAVREKDFIDAARATGAGEARIIVKHVLPNVFPIILVYATMGIGGAIGSTAGLSFIGLGARPNQPDWGGDMNLARQDFLMGRYWTTFYPGLAIFMVVLGFNLLGDWLRDVLDPRTRDV